MTQKCVASWRPPRFSRTMPADVVQFYQERLSGASAGTPASPGFARTQTTGEAPATAATRAISSPSGQMHKQRRLPRVRYAKSSFPSQANHDTLEPGQDSRVDGENPVTSNTRQDKRRSSWATAFRVRS